MESSTLDLLLLWHSFLVALQLSVQDGAAADQSNPTDVNKLLADQSFVSSILSSVSLACLLYTLALHYTIIVD